MRAAQLAHQSPDGLAHRAAGEVELHWSRPPQTIAGFAPSINCRFPAVHRGEKWTGYFGAPRYASAALGRRLLEAENREWVALALRILDGLDERQISRYSATATAK